MLQLPKRWRTAAQARHIVASQLKARYFLRLHALALFAWTFGIAYLMSTLIFATGIKSFSIRYLIIGLFSYAGFLIGVRIWLWFVEATQDPGSGNNRDVLDAGDMLDLTDASLDLADVAGTVSRDIAGEFSGDAASGIGDGLTAAGEGCGPILVIGALALIVALLFAILGPELLIEIAFEAVLAGSLVGAMRLGREPHWLSAVFRKTIWTFLIIMFAMMLFGKYAQKNYPEAQTTKEVIHQIMHAPEPSTKNPNPQKK